MRARNTVGGTDGEAAVPVPRAVLGTRQRAQSRQQRADPADRERGSATVLLLAVVVVALVIATGAIALARAAHARGTAQAAADLAAIAAADAAQSPESRDPCALAAEVVEANGAVTTRCAVEAGGFVTVAAAVMVVPLAGWGTTATATSRAGPAT